MYFKLLFAAIVGVSPIPSAIAQSSIYNVKELIPETGKTLLITEELQSIIDRCNREGGGYVYFPTGEYLIGSIILKSNVYLDLSPGATIYGSMDIENYTEAASRCLIYAKGAKNFGIIGKGTINGNGDFFWKGKSRPYNRPDRFMLFEDCEHIQIKGIKMLNSPNWNLELKRSKFVWVDGITMISDLNSPNSDGIDPTSSSNVFISNSYFELGDDVICPKSEGTIPTENILVENCVLISDDSAIKLGTRSEAPIRNLVFNNIIIRNSHLGIALFAKDGGIYENVRFSNITIETALDDDKSDRPRHSFPIFVDIERRNPGGPITSINDIHFSDITINSTEGHCLFLGQPDEKITNVYLSNINFHLDEHRTFAGLKKPRGTRSLKDRASNDYSHIPSNFTFAYVDGLNIEHLNIEDRDESGLFERHMLWGYEVSGAKIDGFSNRIASSDKALSQVLFKESQNVQIVNSQPQTMDVPFVELQGASTKSVLIMGNILSGQENWVKLGDGVDEDEFEEFMNFKK